MIPGARAGALCPCAANSDVAFGEVSVPVCRRHASMYIRWGAYAQTHAEEEWGWVTDPGNARPGVATVGRVSDSNVQI